MGCTIEPVSFRGRPAVAVNNDVVELIVTTGGGHIASFTRVGQGLNVLWEPPWSTVDPALRNIAQPSEFDDSLESKLLSNILGHNLCVDVFGGQSEGEARSGLTFHGEAGMVTWDVVSAESGAEGATLSLSAFLRHTAMEITRVIHLAAGSSCVEVKESVKNLVGFERAYGCAQHATLGEAFLKDRPALFACNADKGWTWPHDDLESITTFAANREFDYPNIPRRDDGSSDWREFPRADDNSDLCTLRINPADRHGWFTAVQNAHKLALYYIWEREAFPWLMDWEESYTRSVAPWNKRNLSRGMEFSSYAFALSRRENVQIGELLNTPTFRWLDAYETHTTTFYMGLESLIDTLPEAPAVTRFRDLPGA